jgi:hypothetical protein
VGGSRGVPHRAGRLGIGIFKQVPYSHERTVAMLDFMGNTWFMILMAVILLGLIGLFIYLRNQKPED